MLKEIKKTSQRQDEPKRRWFSNTNMDLFVWFNENDEIVSYQLTYNKPNTEKALIWNRASGFSHLGVDEGLRPGKHPGSPLLVEDGIINTSKIISMLRNNSGELDLSIKKFIICGIEENFK